MDARKTLIVAALILQPVAALASAHWLCGLSEELTQLICVADAEVDVVDEAPPAQTVNVKGTQFPLDKARRWTVDFWAPASDMDRLRQLANATLCYGTPNCSVNVSAPALELALAVVSPERKARRRR